MTEANPRPDPRKPQPVSDARKEETDAQATETREKPFFTDYASL